MNHLLIGLVCLALILLSATPAAADPAAPDARLTGVTTLLSVSAGGVPGNFHSSHPLISSDARYVAYMSDANNLVPGDTNAASDVFVLDRQTGAVELISIGLGGAPANGGSTIEDLSPDGRFVVYSSDASNLVPNDGNNAPDVFVYDRLAGITERVSVSSGEIEGDEPSIGGAISSDGRYVVYESNATNLVNDDTNLELDIFRRDRQSGVTVRISIANNEAQADGYSYDPEISANGRYIFFTSVAANLITNDTNNVADVYRRDFNGGATIRISVPAGGGEANGDSSAPSVSSDGRYVVFQSVANNLTPNDSNNRSDVFLRDVTAGATTRLSISTAGVPGNHYANRASISPNGEWAVFCSAANNLVGDDTNDNEDVFLRHIPSGTVERVSLTTFGNEGSLNSRSAAVGNDSRYVVFDSAYAFAPQDTNRQMDIFLRDRQGVSWAIFAPLMVKR